MRFVAPILCFLCFGCFATSEPTVLYEHDETLLTTTFNVIVTSGASWDPEGKRGLTNLMGELMVRGTKSKTRSEFQNAVEGIGATVSASVTDDYIAVSGQVIKENTEEFIALLKETLVEPRFDEEQFKSLKTEVLAEIVHTKNSNTRLAGLALRKEIFKGTPIEISSTGTLSTVESIQLSDIKKQYKKRFHRGNFIFAVASPLPESKMRESIKKIWSAFPEGKRQDLRSWDFEIPKKPKLVLVHKAKTSTGSLFFGQKGITASEDDRYALDVGNFAFGSEPLVSRLFRTVRSELGYTYSVGSTYRAMGQLSNQKGLYVISATPSVEFTSKTMLKIVEMWKDYLKKGLVKQELSLAHESLVNSYPFQFDSAGKRLMQSLSTELYSVPMPSPEEYRSIIEGVSNKDVKKAINAHHSSMGWVLTLVADEAVIRDQLAKAQKDVPEGKRIEIAQVVKPESLIE